MSRAHRPFASLVRGIDGLFLDSGPARGYLLAEAGTPEVAWARAAFGDDRVLSYDLYEHLGPYPATADLLRASDIGQCLHHAGIADLLLPVSSSAAIREWARDSGVNLLGPNPTLQSHLEDKLWFDAFLRRHHLPVPKGGPFRLYPPEPLPIAGPCVLQIPDSMGGEGTYFVNDRADVDALVRDRLLPLRGELLLREAVVGRPLGLTLFISEDCVALSAARLQCYYPPRGGGLCFAGIQWQPTSALDSALRARLDDRLLHLGLLLHQAGYRGPANIDLIATPDGEPLIIECNPRLSAATPQLFRHPALLHGLPAGRLLIEAFRNKPCYTPNPRLLGLPDSDFAGATLDLVHRLGAPEVILGDEPVNGAWSTRTAEGGAAAWLRAGLRPDDELTVIRLAHPNETTPGGTNIATLLASRPLFTEEGAFLPETVTLLMQLRGPT